jgi:hypothetical protein
MCVVFIAPDSELKIVEHVALQISDSDIKHDKQVALQISESDLNIDDQEEIILDDIKGRNAREWLFNPPSESWKNEFCEKWSYKYSYA